MAGSVLVDKVQTNLTGYTIQEDATPLDPSDTTGGVGQLDFSAEYLDGPEGSIQLQGLDVELRDNLRGSSYGTITDVSLGDDSIVAMTANGRLGSLVGTVSAKPMVDSLQNVVMYYLALGGITDGIAIDPDIGALPVAAPGFNDDLWLRLKQIISVARAEITLVGNSVVVRPVRSFESNTEKKTAIGWSISKDEAAQNIEVTYYGNDWLSDTVVYPYTDDEHASGQTWQVEDGSVLEDDITTTVSLARIDQPECVDYVPQNYGTFGDEDDDPTTPVAGPITGSVYSVYDADNYPITAQNWRKGGGKIEATISPETTAVHVKITAAKGVGKTPYRIVGRTTPSSYKSVVESKTTTDYNKKNTAKDNVTTTTITGINTEATDDSEDYPSFYLVGSGVATNPRVLTVPTGVAVSTTVTEVGTTIAVPTVSNVAQAYDVGVYAARSWTGANMTLSGTLTSINQISSTGEIKYRYISDFNAEYAGQSIAQFNAKWANKTVKNFNDHELSLVADTFDNQIFGNVAGARLKYGDAYYRIDTATVSNEDIQFTASADTTIEDFNAAVAGLTIAQFNTRFQGKTFRQFNRIPLSTLDSTKTIFVPAAIPTAPYPDTFYPDTLYPDADPVLVARVGFAIVGVSTLG